MTKKHIRIIGAGKLKKIFEKRTPKHDISIPFTIEVLFMH
jgi:hypothetical protein